jgi:hypothetical protein
MKTVHCFLNGVKNCLDPEFLKNPDWLFENLFGWILGWIFCCWLLLDKLTLFVYGLSAGWFKIWATDGLFY